MKRDMDLIREILLKVEADPQLDGSHAYKTFEASDFKGHSQEEITYHVDLLFEARLVEGIGTLDQAPAISRLTWQGHEFIADISDATVWAVVKERTRAFPEVALSLVWEIAKAELRRRLGV